MNKAQDIVNDMIYNEEIEVTFNCYYVRATLIENNDFIDLDKFLETGEIITFTLDLSGNA